MQVMPWARQTASPPKEHSVPVQAGLKEDWDERLLLLREDDREELREEDDPTQRMQGRSLVVTQVKPLNPQKRDPPCAHSVPSHCPPTTEEEDALERRDETEEPELREEEDVLLRLLLSERRDDDVALRTDDVPELRLLSPDDWREEDDEQNHGYCSQKESEAVEEERPEEADKREEVDAPDLLLDMPQDTLH